MDIIKISKEQFDQFAETAEYQNIWQTSKYGNAMMTLGYDTEYIGFFYHGKMLGASVLLSKIVYMGFKHHYMPRGLVTNYNDIDLVKASLRELKRFLYKEKSLGVNFDPLILKSIRSPKGEIILDNNLNNLYKAIRRCGADYLEKNLYFEGIQPRFYAALRLKSESTEKFFKSLSKQTKNKLRKSVKYGVEIYQDQTENIDELFSFFSKYSNHPINYYQELKNNFKDDFEVYYAKVNTERYMQNSKILYEKETEDNDFLTNTIQSDGYKGINMRKVLNKKMESDKILASFKQHMITATDLLKNYPTGITIAAFIIIKEKKTIHILEEYQDKTYSNLNPLALLRWKLIEKCIDQRFEKIDFGPVTGEFDKTKNQYYGLTEAKTRFHGEVEEYIGEFGIIVNKTMYSLYAGSGEKQKLMV